jgi:adenine-specific DNA-methyltransferase
MVRVFQMEAYEDALRDLGFELIDVNSDNNLENLWRPDQTWKVRLIEDEFQRLMFGVQDF